MADGDVRESRWLLEDASPDAFKEAERDLAARLALDYEREPRF